MFTLLLKFTKDIKTRTEMWKILVLTECRKFALHPQHRRDKERLQVCFRVVGRGARPLIPLG